MAEIDFAVTCPKCGRILQEVYDRDRLTGLLKGGSVVPAYCVYCDHHWEISDLGHIQRIKEHLKRTTSSSKHL